MQNLESHVKFREENKLNFPVLSDDRREVAARYGVLTGPDGVAKRHTFYIDPTGVVRKVDDKVQPFSAAKDVLSNLKELQKPEPATPAANTKMWDDAIRNHTAAVKKNPGNQAAKIELATALYLKGRSTMLNTALPPRNRYPAALKLFDQALKYHPNLIAAKEDRASIVAVYRQMGRPVPKG